MTCKCGRLNFSEGRFQARTTLEPERRCIDVVERTSGSRALTGDDVSTAVHLRSETEANEREGSIPHIHPDEIGQHRR